MVRAIQSGGDGVPEVVAAYKRILAAIIERRPSGTRLRLSTALGKNRSFISQITNPAYATPIPAQHVETILAVCRFSPRERRDFLAAYSHAHPARRIGRAPIGQNSPVTGMSLPDLGHADLNQRLQALVSEFTRKLVQLIEESHAKGDGT